MDTQKFTPKLRYTSTLCRYHLTPLRLFILIWLSVFVGTLGCQDDQSGQKVLKHSMKSRRSELGTLSAQLSLPEGQQCHLFRALDLADNEEVFRVDVLHSRVHNNRYQFLQHLPAGAYELYGILDKIGLIKKTRDWKYISNI